MLTQEPKSLDRASHIQEYEAGDYLMKQVLKPNPGVVLSSTHACSDTDMPASMYTFVHIHSGSGGLGLYLITCQGRKVSLSSAKGVVGYVCSLDLPLLCTFLPFVESDP